MEPVKILTGLCPQIRKTERWPAETGRVGTHPDLQETRCQGGSVLGAVALLPHAGHVRLNVMEQRLPPCVEPGPLGAPGGLTAEEALRAEGEHSLDTAVTKEFQKQVCVYRLP